MPREQSLRLPGRLRGVVRTDAAEQHAPALAAAPVLSAAQPPEAHHLDRALAKLSEAASILRGQHQQAVKNLERLAVDLAWSIAARFLHDRLTAGEFPVELLVRQALELLEARQPVTVQLHPDDLALLQKRLAQSPASDLAEVRWVANPGLRRGDCKALAADISVWADFESNLANLRRQLLDTLDEAPVGGG